MTKIEKKRHNRMKIIVKDVACEKKSIYLARNMEKFDKFLFAQGILVVMLLMVRCTMPHETVVLTGQEDFREGDFVLRCGYGAESRVVTAASHSIYSHIGMLHYDKASAAWMVVHAVPGEAAVGEKEVLKVEPLSEFYAYERAVKGAWGRVDCPDSVAAAAATYALSKVEQHVEFDNDYMLCDTTSLYCTELVWQAYLHQGIDLSDGKRHEVPTVVCKEGTCLFPCDIETCSQIIFIKPFKTK
jgi:hypothetical protein